MIMRSSAILWAALTLTFIFANPLDADQRIPHGDFDLLVIGDLSEAEFNEFYRVAFARNAEIVPYPRVDSFDDAEMIVIMLPSWEDALNAPGAKSVLLERIYRDVSMNTNEVLSHVFGLDLSSSKKVTFVFYSMGAIQGLPLACYALDVARISLGLTTDISSC